MNRMSKRLTASFLAVMGSCGLALADDPQELLQRATTNPTTAPTTEPATQTTSARVPVLTTLLSKPQSPMTAVQQRYDADRTVLNRFYVFAFSPTRYARLRMFNADWSAALQNLETDGWTNEAKDQRAKLIETA